MFMLNSTTKGILGCIQIADVDRDIFPNRHSDSSNIKVLKQKMKENAFDVAGMSIVIANLPDILSKSSCEDLSYQQQAFCIISGVLYHSKKQNARGSLLSNFSEKGIDGFKECDGDYVAAILNKKNNTLILVRDKAGVEPLYYYHYGEDFFFSSHIAWFEFFKNFKKELDYAALGLYLQYGYIPAPHTIYKNCYKLLPGHALVYNLSTGDRQLHAYWDVLDYYKKNNQQDIGEEEAMEEINRLLLSACRSRTAGVSSFGALLSGGYDSSVVAALAQKEQSAKLKTYSMGFDESAFDETPYALSVSKYLGTEHTAFYCTADDAKKMLPALPEIYDELFGNSSAIPTSLVYKWASKDVACLLSADGGDEIFGGYSKYLIAQRYHRLFSRLPRRIAKVLSVAMGLIAPEQITTLLGGCYNFDVRYDKVRSLLLSDDVVDAMKIVSQTWSQREIPYLTGRKNTDSLTLFDLEDPIRRGQDFLKALMAVDYKTYMVDDGCVKVGGAANWTGISVRCPMLDPAIVEYVATLPSDYKIRDKQTKYLLKKLVHQYIPKEIMDRPKQGFGIPMQSWLLGALKPFVLEYLDDERIQRDGIFKPAKVRALRENFYAGKKISPSRIWFLLMFQMWHERWMR